MSEFRIEIVKIKNITRVENSDALSVSLIHGGYPCVFRTETFKMGDLAVYIPVDSNIPTDNPNFSFLAKKNKTHYRIRAARLRGQFSMGLLIPANLEWTEGQDVREHFAIEKWEPSAELSTFGDAERGPGTTQHYDIEGLRRWPELFVDGEEVWINEKIHGANSRYLYSDNRLFCGSRTNWKRDSNKSLWWVAARHYHLEEKLKNYPELCFYGEAYGQVQDLKYDVPNGEIRLAFFDILNTKDQSYFGVDDFLRLMKEIDLPVVPTLYRGGWNKELLSLAEGQSTIANNVREGIVIKPVKETLDLNIGRKFLKLHGQGFLLRKE